MGNGSEGRDSEQIAKWLRKNAPKPLNDFTACTVDTLALDVSNLDWVPKGPLGDFAPDVEVSAGKNTNTATISYGPMISIPISLNADGELVADTSGLPGQGPLDFIGDAADDWVKGFNDTMKANKKKLSGLSVKDSKLVANKAKVGAPAPASDPPSGQSEGPGPAVTKPAPAPAPTPAPAPALPWYKRFWKWLLGILILLLLLVLAVVLFTGGDATQSVAGGDPTNQANPGDGAAEEESGQDQAEDETEEQVQDQAEEETENQAEEETDQAEEETDQAEEETDRAEDEEQGQEDSATDPLADVRIVRESQPAGFYDASLGYTPDRLVAVVDPAGDVINCQTGEPVQDPAPDITGFVVNPVPGGYRASVFLDRSPLVSKEHFSFATVIGAGFGSGALRSFGDEIHDGESSSGEFLAESIDPDPLDVLVDDSSVRYGFDHPPEDPPAFFGARGFHTGNEGEDVNCDEVNVELPVDGLPPGPPGPLLFTVDIPTNTWNGVEVGHGPLEPLQFGPGSDMEFFPIFGDWNNDGLPTPGFVDPGDGTITLSNARTPAAGDDRLLIQFDDFQPGDVPLVGDTDSDGDDTVGFFRPQTNQLFTFDNPDDSPTIFDVPDMPLGGDVLLEDFNGDGVDTPGAFVDGTFMWSDTLGGPLTNSLDFGQPGDSGLFGDWNGDGRPTPGVFRSLISSFILDDAVLSSEIFTHGFESGDVSAWSSSIGQ